MQVKDIAIEELPVQPNFEGAPEPKKASKASPLTPDEEQATFTLPPGFEIELVASESPGIGKFVTDCDWDQQGRMWSHDRARISRGCQRKCRSGQSALCKHRQGQGLVFDNAVRAGAA